VTDKPPTLASPTPSPFVDARTLLSARGLRPKRSFGQNFLVNEGVVRRIAELCTPSGDDGSSVASVIEIGAGLGALTSALLDRGGRVVAIERDRDLVPILREELASHLDRGALEIVEADAATIDYRSLFSTLPPPHVLAGNLPYQITGRLLERATELRRDIVRAVFMVQREVADRIVAGPSDEAYGQPSVFVQAAFDVERAIVVRAGSFHPRPDVDSAVIVLTPRALPRAEETQAFRDVVHAAFGSRRKTLKNALAKLLASDAAQTAVAATGIDLGRRGETLSVEELAAIANAIESARAASAT